MKYSLGIANFLEEISSLSHSVVFLYFFALITEEGFISSLLAILWNSAFRCLYLSFSPLLFLLFFSQLFVRPPQTAILLFCISFTWARATLKKFSLCLAVLGLHYSAHTRLPQLRCLGFSLRWRLLLQSTGSEPGVSSCGAKG